ALNVTGLRIASTTYPFWSEVTVILLAHASHSQKYSPRVPLFFGSGRMRRGLRRNNLPPRRYRNEVSQDGFAHSRPSDLPTKMFWEASKLLGAFPNCCPLYWNGKLLHLTVQATHH